MTEFGDSETEDSEVGESEEEWWGATESETRESEEAGEKMKVKRGRERVCDSVIGIPWCHDVGCLLSFSPFFFNFNNKKLLEWRERE